MSQELTLQLSDDAYSLLAEQARQVKQSPQKIAQTTLESILLAGGRLQGQAESGSSRGQFKALFGAIDLGHPTGCENESIDANLARSYGRT